MTDDRLQALLREAPPGNPADGATLLARARERRRAVRRASAAGGGVLALLVLGLSFTVLRPSPVDPATLAPRGVQVPPVHLGLSWRVEDAELRRARPDEVGSDQRVLFHASVDRPGYLCLAELDAELRWQRVLPPPTDSWRVEPGSHFYAPGGDVQSFRTDGPPGSHAYRLAFHPTNPGCEGAEQHVDAEITWLP